ncbi:MAG: hypothetical protein PVJ03_11875 [Chromatiaceae bacterium]|jgi:hypothetical protein
MTQMKDLARQYLDQAYFIGGDGLLYTPVGRAARSTIRVGRTVYPAAPLIAEMQRQIEIRGIPMHRDAADEPIY